MLRKLLYIAACNYYGCTLGHEGFAEDVDYYFNLGLECGYSEDALLRIVRSGSEDAE